MNCIDFSCVNYSSLIAFGKKRENKTHGKISHSTVLQFICAWTVDQYIGQRMFLCAICALKHVCTNRHPNVCAQTVDEYFGWPFAVPEMLICNLYIKPNKIYRCIWKALLSLILTQHYNTPLKLVCPLMAFTVCCPMQEMVDQCFSAQAVAWADSYLFAVQIFLLCNTKAFFIRRLYDTYREWRCVWALRFLWSTRYRRASAPWVRTWTWEVWVRQSCTASSDTYREWRCVWALRFLWSTRYRLASAPWVRTWTWEVWVRRSCIVSSGLASGVTSLVAACGQPSAGEYSCPRNEKINANKLLCPKNFRFNTSKLLLQKS